MHSEVKILEFAHERRQITPHQYADYQRLKVQSFQAFFLLTVFPAHIHAYEGIKICLDLTAEESKGEIEQTMKTTIQQFGNTLALCIPDAATQQAHVTPDTIVQISIEDHRLVVVLPEVGDEAQPESLEQLLAGVTADNRHQEVETGAAVGREVW